MSFDTWRPLASRRSQSCSTVITSASPLARWALPSTVSFARRQTRAPLLDRCHVVGEDAAFGAQSIGHLAKKAVLIEPGHESLRVFRSVRSIAARRVKRVLPADRDGDGNGPPARKICGAVDALPGFAAFCDLVDGLGQGLVRSRLSAPQCEPFHVGVARLPCRHVGCVGNHWPGHAATWSSG